MLHKETLRKRLRHIVVSLAILVGIALLSQSVFASVEPSTIQAAVPANHTLAGVYDHTKQLAGDAITDTDTPTSTETPTSTSTPTGSVTLTPAMLVGHVSRCCSNSVQPISLTLMMGGTQIDYPIQNTDASGYFTVSVEGLASGTYNYRAKDPKFLAKAGTVTLSGAPITQLEIGSLTGGDANNDNVVDSIDFSILRANFGRSCGDPLFDVRADFNNDCIVNAIDDSIHNASVGSLGAPPDTPAPPSSGDAFLSFQPASGGNCTAPANGGTVQVGCRFVLDMMVNMGSVPDVVAMQGYMTFTSSILPNARVSDIASSCVPTSVVTADSTIFDYGMQNEVCNGPAPCTFRPGGIGITVAAGSFAFGRGALSYPPTDGTFRVAQTGWCAVAPGQAVLHWQFSPPAPRNRHTAIVDANGNMVQDQSLFTDYVINIVGPTNTPTITPTNTPSAAAIINGHLTWQNVAAANRPSVTGTLQLCVSGSTQTFPFTTDTDGNFTVWVTASLPDGTYHWRTKGGRHISSSSPADGPDLIINNGRAMQEFGTQRGGNGNSDNIVNANDFSFIKNQFGQGGIKAADFDYNYVVNVSDFNIQKTNFGRAGHALTCP